MKRILQFEKEEAEAVVARGKATFRVKGNQVTWNQGNPGREKMTFGGKRQIERLATELLAPKVEKPKAVLPEKPKAVLPRWKFYYFDPRTRTGDVRCPKCLRTHYARQQGSLRCYGGSCKLEFEAVP